MMVIIVIAISSSYLVGFKIKVEVGHVGHLHVVHQVGEVGLWKAFHLHHRLPDMIVIHWEDFNILTTLRGWWWQKPGLRISWRTIDWLDALPPLRFGPGQCGQCPVDMKFTIIWLTMNTFYHFTHYHRRYNHHRHHFLFYHLLSVMCLCWLLMNLGVSVSLRPAIINMLMILMKITTISWFGV